MRRLLACLPDRHAQQTQLARLETVTDQQKAEMGPLLERVRLLTPGDIPALYDLYMKLRNLPITTGARQGKPAMKTSG